MPNTFINYLQLLRAPAVLTALSNILAAYLIVAQDLAEWPKLILLLIASASLYLSGMVLNDCFDYSEDCRERPDRPLPSGRIKLELAWRLGWSLMGVGLITAGIAGFPSFIVGFTLAVFIVLYNSYAKKSLFGTVVMGSCRYLNWLLGLSIVPLRTDLLLLPIPIWIYVSALTLLSTVETSADKKSRLILAGLGIMLSAAVILLFQLIFGTYSGPAAIAWLVALGAVLFRLASTFKNFNAVKIQKTVKYLIMGIIPLDALIVLSWASLPKAIVILSLLLPGSLLARRMRVT